MDGYKDGDRRRSDALEITRPLVRGSRGPLHKTPAAEIAHCGSRSFCRRLHPPRRSPCRANLRTQTMSAFAHLLTLSLNSKPFLRTIHANPAQGKNKWCAAKHSSLRTFLCIALPVAITTEVTTAFCKMRW